MDYLEEINVKMYEKMNCKDLQEKQFLVKKSRGQGLPPMAPS